MSKKPVPTMEELQKVIERQSELLEKPGLSRDPNFIMDPHDPVRKELREVSRKRTWLTNRLAKALKKFEDDFDLSS